MNSEDAVGFGVSEKLHLSFHLADCARSTICGKWEAAFSVWDLSLFDVQTYNEFELNEETTLTIPTFIEGESSGAKGYLRFPVSAGTALTAYNTQGTFSLGERLKFNGESTGQRTVIDSTKYDISDIQSVYSIVGSAGTVTTDSS